MKILQEVLATRDKVVIILIAIMLMGGLLSTQLKKMIKLITRIVEIIVIMPIIIVIVEVIIMLTIFNLNSCRDETENTMMEFKQIAIKKQQTEHEYFKYGFMFIDISKLINKCYD